MISGSSSQALSSSRLVIAGEDQDLLVGQVDGEGVGGVGNVLQALDPRELRQIDPIQFWLEAEEDCCVSEGLEDKDIDLVAGTGQLEVPLPGDDELIVRSGRPHVAAGLWANDCHEWDRLIGQYIEGVGDRHSRPRRSNRTEASRGCGGPWLSGGNYYRKA